MKQKIRKRPHYSLQVSANDEKGRLIKKDEPYESTEAETLPERSKSLKGWHSI